MSIKRREFLALAAAPALLGAVAAPFPWQQQPLEFGEVRLTGGLLKQRFDLNARRTFAIKTADIAMPFLRAKGLPSSGKELNEGFLSGRQSVVWPGLYSGFWMSGAAHIARWSGDPTHRETLVRLTHELAKTRESDGFLLALGRDAASRWAHSDLFALVRVTVRALLDTYEVTGEQLALDLARGQMDSMIRDIMGHPRRGDGILLRGADPAKVEPSWYKLLPALAQLYRHTGDGRYLDVAGMCLDLKLMAKVLAGGRDLLPGRHASTWTDHLMGVYQIGVLTGERDYTDFAIKAAQRIREHHLFLTGSMSGNEEWRAGENGWQLPENNRAQETCCAAIWITLLESLLRGTGDMIHADYIERAAYNALFPSQSPETGDFSYFVNLSGNGKPYDPPPEWGRHCCEGTGLMAIGRLPGLIYGKTPDGLAVNLYAACEATPKIAGVRVRITQETDYPYGGMVRLRFQPDRPVRFAVHYRVPSWSKTAPEVKVNGETWTAAGPILREWKTGDEIVLAFDVRPQVIEGVSNGVSRAALQQGPIVMAATWEDRLPVPKATLNKVIHGSHSHFEQWPYLPTLLANGKMPAALEAEAVTPYVPGFESKPERVKIRYVPFLDAIRSKYSVWLPVSRRLS